MIYFLNSDDNKLILNKLDTNYNTLQIDTVNFKGYISLSESRFLINENIYIVIDNKVNLLNIKSKNFVPLNFNSNSEINKILGVYNDYFILLYYSTDKTITGEPIPDIRLINYNTNKEIKINSKYIIKGLVTDIETEDGYDNLEYST